MSTAEFPDQQLSGCRACRPQCPMASGRGPMNKRTRRRAGRSRIYGISDDKGRLMVIVTYNSDLGDAWEHMDVACYPEKYSGQAYRMGINFVVYAMTH